MTSSDFVTDPKDGAKRVLELLDRVRTEGRRVLVVVGAGCSYPAGMPLMKEVYAYLNKELKAYSGADNQLRKLRQWLEVLENDGGPRSVAAQALGLFQQPQLITEEEPRKFLEGTWKKFATDFLSWNIAPNRKPPNAGPTILSAETTNFHEKIAGWVRTGLAIVLSLNFDGLTRKAIEKAAKQEGKDERCVILARHEEIDQYFFGEQGTHSGDEGSRLWAVVKAHGDVFHATCRNELCPECQQPAPIYNLQRQLERQKELSATDPGPNVSDSGGTEAQQSEAARLARMILRCPECGNLRHLEISFTGYQRKEEEAEEVLDGLRECVMPGIGGIITVGVSGLWDEALVELFERAGKLWKDDDNTEVRRLICVDRKHEGAFSKPFLVKLLEGAD